MSKPAARLGDMTAHGGSIVAGLPTVLIGGAPAARVGDMHVCPMFNPGTPPPPHVGGPVAMGSAGVLIGGVPAARMGDMAVCAGPPDTIVMGCPTVLVGEVGSASASGGGAGASAVAGAQASARVAAFDNLESTTKLEHWVEFQFVDSAGLPISGVHYKFTDPDGDESYGVLRPDGTIRRDGLSEGECEVVLMHVSNAQWEKEEAEVGETVTMSADVEGFEDGTPATFQVFKRDLKGPDVVVAEVPAEVKGGEVEGEWTFVYDEENPERKTIKNPQYSSPAFYFDIIVERVISRSKLLTLQDFIELELTDPFGNPIPDEEYIVVAPNGEVRKGKLDGNGYAKEEGLAPGYCDVRFPNRPGV